MFTVRGIYPESRKEMYLKYTKSTIFNSPKKKETPYKITDKITSKEYSKQFEPQYDTTTARERYMNHFYQSKEHKQPETKTRSRNYQQTVPTSLSRELNGNSETQESKIRRSKSLFFNDRSFTSRDIDRTKMDSRQRKLDGMQSDIFFLSKDDINNNLNKTMFVSQDINTCNEDNSQTAMNSRRNKYSECNIGKIKRSKTVSNFKNLLRNIPPDTFSNNNNPAVKAYNSFQKNNNHSYSHYQPANVATATTISYRNKISHNNPMGIYMKNVNQQVYRRFNRSKYGSNTDWKYFNTEEQNKTQPTLKKFYGRKEIVNKGNERDPELVPYYLTTENICKKNKSYISNLNSVSYDLITSKPLSSHLKVSSFMNKDNTKSKPVELLKFEIEVGKDFNPANGCKIKNLIRSEGLHLFDFVDTGQCITGPKPSKYTFNIRKNLDDPQFEERLRNVSDKLNKRNLQLVRNDKKYVRPM